MSCFDNVSVDPSLLPDDTCQYVKDYPHFQTNDLGNGMNDYEITAEGELKVYHSWLANVICEAIKVENTIKWPPIIWKRKRLELYTSDMSQKQQKLLVYVAQFRNGKLSSLKLKQ